MIMAKKLFAMEGTDLSDNELLIDKVLKQSKQEKEPISLTADLLKQTSTLKEEIKETLKKTESESEENDDEEDTSSSTKNEDSDNEENKDDKKEEDTESSDNGEDDSADADDPDKLDAIVGSASKDNDKKEDKETSTESRKVTGQVKGSFFKSLKLTHNNYLNNLKCFSLENMAVDAKDQPVTYVKEAILESLDKMIQDADKLLKFNQNAGNNYANSAKTLNEKITVFKLLTEQSGYEFTNKLISEQTVILPISVSEKSDPRDTSKILLNYLEHSVNAAKLITNNDFDKMSSAFTQSDFKEEEGELVYSRMIPGFNWIRVHNPIYTDYLNVNMEEYTFYKATAYTVKDVYALENVSVTDEKELEYLFSVMSNLTVEFTTTVDLITKVTELFDSYVNQLKVSLKDVQDDRFTKLTEIGIDNKVKNYIKFKLLFSMLHVNVDLITSYMTSVLSILNVAVKIKGQ